MEWRTGEMIAESGEGKEERKEDSWYGWFRNGFDGF